MYWIELQHRVHHRRRPLQVCDRFEQRDHLEGRCDASGRMARQLVNGGAVAHIACEAHDISPASLWAKVRLQRGHRTQRVEHLFGGCRWLGPCANLSKRTHMDEAVLAHLELGEMKPECLGLPDEVLELAVRQPGSACGRQRRLHCSKVVE